MTPTPSRRTFLGGTALAALTLASTAPAAGALVGGRPWPTVFPLPDGWLPEGIAIGNRPYAYLGSRAHGGIYRADLRTGEGKVLYAGAPGRFSLGLKLDRTGLLYTAGNNGVAHVLDARSGEPLFTYRLSEPTGHFINDVALLDRHAWFTDSSAAVLFGVPQGRRAGRVRTLPLTGDWTQQPNVINANGAVGTPDGRALIVVNSTLGELHRVDLATGRTTRLTLTGQPDVLAGDGLYRVGRTLYVVQNRLNRVSVWTLDRGATSATLSRTITSPDFDVPTTAARYGHRLYLVNARFTSPQTPQTTFTGVSVPL